jgi:hypothetical protein
MSLAKPTPLLNLGDIRGVVYNFEKAGDILAKHNHTEETAHITIIARGSIKAYSHDWDMVITAGQVVDFPANQPHEFMSLEDNTKVINIIKKHGGAVNDYASVEPTAEPTAPVMDPIDAEYSVTYI